MINLHKEHVLSHYTKNIIQNEQSCPFAPPMLIDHIYILTKDFAKITMKTET